LAKCHKCGIVFTEEDILNASNGKGIPSPMGDWDWVCYDCELKMIDNGTYEAFRVKMLELHNGSGQCSHS